ncbi:hypothetical protein NUU61_002194 [Penicillium alfredii]|uniref:Uncharacterized protein n=1 Tax=Penicillium alfredii TaxID=1506179 RepID=A0A9W9FR81_9EURO|nr:uncharacterized protein NUU61_002194 [Penicillium alfredii]KAJ5104847.1 hypothetical protein NUU61_002194 [Penicillium alfredii]
MRNTGQVPTRKSAGTKFGLVASKLCMQCLFYQGARSIKRETRLLKCGRGTIISVDFQRLGLTEEGSVGPSTLLLPTGTPGQIPSQLVLTGIRPSIWLPP